MAICNGIDVKNEFFLNVIAVLTKDLPYFMVGGDEEHSSIKNETKKEKIDKGGMHCIEIQMRGKTGAIDVSFNEIAFLSMRQHLRILCIKSTRCNGMVDVLKK